MRPTAPRAPLTTAALAALALVLVGAGTPAAATTQASTVPAAVPAGLPAGLPAVLPAATTVDQTPLVASRLRSRGTDSRLGGYASGQVIDLATGKAIWSRSTTTGRLPASNQKLITAYVALKSIGGSARLTTPVLQAKTYRSSLYLKGVGDPTLSSTRLATMADTVVSAMREQGIYVVKVYVDDSLFPAPTNSAGWNPDWVPDEVAPVRPLVVDQANLMDTGIGAGNVFAKMLRDRGLPVKQVARAKVEAGSTTLATTLSPTVGSMVQVMLNVSHNDYAEMLFRLAGVKRGYNGGWSGARENAWWVLRHYGVNTSGLAIYDGSGLSRSDRMTVTTALYLVKRMREQQDVNSVVFAAAGMPIAGVSGTLEDRFRTAPTSCARNRVKAKTGTLSDVVTLSGVAMGGDGRERLFSVMVNNNTATTSARAAVDLLATTATGCY